MKKEPTPQIAEAPEKKGIDEKSEKLAQKTSAMEQRSTAVAQRAAQA